MKSNISSMTAAQLQRAAMQKAVEKAEQRAMPDGRFFWTKSNDELNSVLNALFANQDFKMMIAAYLGHPASVKGELEYDIQDLAEKIHSRTLTTPLAALADSERYVLWKMSYLNAWRTHRDAFMEGAERLAELRKKEGA